MSDNPKRYGATPELTHTTPASPGSTLDEILAEWADSPETMVYQLACDVEQLTRERDEAHAALRSCIDALQNGSAVSSDSSHEFHCRAPEEVAAYCRKLERERDEAWAELSKTCESYGAYASCATEDFDKLRAELDRMRPVVAAVNACKAHMSTRLGPEPIAYMPEADWEAVCRAAEALSQTPEGGGGEVLSGGTAGWRPAGAGSNPATAADSPDTLREAVEFALCEAFPVAYGSRVEKEGFWCISGEQVDRLRAALAASPESEVWCIDCDHLQQCEEADRIRWKCAAGQPGAFGAHRCKQFKSAELEPVDGLERELTGARAEASRLSVHLPCLSADGTFHCACGAAHMRGPVNGVDVYRCLRCGRTTRIEPRVTAESEPKPAEGVNLNELGQLANENAHAHGWYDEPNPIPQQIALMHSELSEALECYRDGDMEVKVTEKGKPVGFPTELADIIIRVVDTAYEMGIDLDAVVRQKMAYNKSRPYKHGRKVL